MRTAKLRIGIVGCGAISSDMHFPVLLSMLDVQVVWASDTNRALGKVIAAAHGVPFVESPIPCESTCDVILLAIPVKPRRPYVEACAAAGVALFVEKPFARSYSEQIELRSLFQPFAIGCGYQRRTYSNLNFMREAILRGLFGRLSQISIREGGRTTKTAQDSSYQNLAPEDGGGIILNLGCHGLDSALYVTNAIGADVRSKTIVWDGTTDRRAEASIFIRGTGAAEQGCEFDFCVSWLDEQPNEIILTFEKVELSCKTKADSIVVMRDRASKKIMASFDIRDCSGAWTPSQAFYLEWRYFLDGVRTRAPSLMAAQSSDLTAKLLDDLVRH